jgi:hypothetical protein
MPTLADVTRFRIKALKPLYEKVEAEGQEVRAAGKWIRQDTDLQFAPRSMEFLTMGIMTHCGYPHTINGVTYYILVRDLERV